MEVEYMRKQVRERLDYVSYAYKQALNDTTVLGKKVSLAGGRCLRSRLKRDICILKLVSELLDYSYQDEVVDEDAIIGFEKLLGGIHGA